MSMADGLVSNIARSVGLGFNCVQPASSWTAHWTLLDWLSQCPPSWQTDSRRFSILLLIDHTWLQVDSNEHCLLIMFMLWPLPGILCFKQLLVVCLCSSTPCFLVLFLWLSIIYLSLYTQSYYSVHHEYLVCTMQVSAGQHKCNGLKSAERMVWPQAARSPPTWRAITSTMRK